MKFNAIMLAASIALSTASTTRGFIATVDQLESCGKHVTLLGDVHSGKDTSAYVEKQFNVLTDAIQHAHQPLVLVECGVDGTFEELLPCRLWNWLESTEIEHIDIEVRPNSWRTLAQLINRSRKEPALVGGDISPHLTQVSPIICDELKATATKVCLSGPIGASSPTTCQNLHTPLQVQLDRIPGIIERLSPIIPSPKYEKNLCKFIAIPNWLVNIEALKHILLASTHNVFVISGTQHTRAIATLLEQEGFTHTRPVEQTSEPDSREPISPDTLAAMLPSEKPTTQTGVK